MNNEHPTNHGLIMTSQQLHLIIFHGTLAIKNITLPVCGFCLTHRQDICVF